MTVTTHLDSGPRDTSPLCGADSTTVSNDIEDVTCWECETAHELTSQTPVEIDTALAALYDAEQTLRYESQRAQERVMVQANMRFATEKPSRYGIDDRTVGTIEDALAKCEQEAKGSLYTAQYAQRALAAYAQAKAALASNLAEQKPLHAEYARRGGWTRAFLVLNAGGHVHSTRSCSTCFWDTRFGWLPGLSGHDEDEIVEAAGSDACTVCYPTAPVIAKPRSIFHGTEIEAQQARAKRAAEKAEREAKKAAKAIGPLKVFDWMVPERRYQQRDGSVRVEPAHERFETLETLHAAKAWLTDSQESWGRTKRPEDITLVAEAIAAKLGTSAEAEIAAAAKRAAKRK